MAFLNPSYVIFSHPSVNGRLGTTNCSSFLNDWNQSQKPPTARGFAASLA